MLADALMLASLLTVWAWLRMPRETYRDYLKSPGWALTKAVRKNWKCARCGTWKRLQLHHREYTWHNRHKIIRFILPNLFDEMETLCDFHHGKEHGHGK